MFSLGFIFLVSFLSNDLRNLVEHVIVELYFDVTTTSKLKYKNQATK